MRKSPKMWKEVKEAENLGERRLEGQPGRAVTGSEAKHAGGDRTGRTVPVTLHVTSAYIHCVLRRLSRRLSGKESTHQAGDMGSFPGLGRFPGEGNGNPVHHSCLENPMDRGA